MQLRMCASSASAPVGDATATQGREVREEGGAQGNWASEEGLKHSKKVSWRARSVTLAMSHHDGTHAKNMFHEGELGCTRQTPEGKIHAQQRHRIVASMSRGIHPLHRHHDGGERPGYSTLSAAAPCFTRLLPFAPAHKTRSCAQECT